MRTNGASYQRTTSEDTAGSDDLVCKVNVKISLLQAMEAHRVVRGEG
jgi:hypothetical protein